MAWRLQFYTGYKGRRLATIWASHYNPEKRTRKKNIESHAKLILHLFFALDSIITPKKGRSIHAIKEIPCVYCTGLKKGDNIGIYSPGSLRSLADTCRRTLLFRFLETS